MEHAPRLTQVWRANISSPACIRYAADYRYLIAYEIIAQGWKKRLGPEFVGGGGGGKGGCILKIVIAKGYNFHM